MDILQQLFPLPPIPTLQQAVFIPLALFTAICALTVVMSPNLFHNALALVGTLFGVAGLYALLEAEFLAVSQVLVYIGAISTLITFAIMLTRGMMFGATSQVNKQAGTSAMIMGLFFIVLAGIVAWAPWPEIGAPIVGSGEQIIARIGELFVTSYLVPFELMALLLLVALAGAILLARDRN
jgi:NADH:ubiquinone oxidoreductase subunit 6 (subunit J)